MDSMTTPIEQLIDQSPQQMQNTMPQVPPSYNEMLAEINKEQNMNIQPPPPVNTYQPPINPTMNTNFAQYQMNTNQPINQNNIPTVEKNEDLLNNNELINICIIGVILHSPFVQDYAIRNMGALYKNGEPTLVSAIFFGILTALLFIAMKKVNIKLN